ncbi:unnamed protein product [Owenia fusiformis]|uniref:Uncharacterized protein n=1 Tax=Owenia fusiformis TaxID=6347 RepID=A0A8J1XSR0_OWEFU|nr:unnamed protein product [Owenia fusiformis]
MRYFKFNRGDIKMYTNLKVIYLSFAIAFLWEIANAKSTRTCWGKKRTLKEIECQKGHAIRIIEAFAHLDAKSRNRTCDLPSYNQTTCTQYDITQDVVDTLQGWTNNFWTILKINLDTCCSPLRCQTINYECIPAKCPQLYPPQDGQIQPSNSTRDVGSKVTYSCSTGYRISNVWPPSRSCKLVTSRLPSNGRLQVSKYDWNRRNPRCDLDPKACNMSVRPLYSLGHLCFEDHFNKADLKSSSESNAFCTSKGSSLLLLSNEDVRSLLFEIVRKATSLYGNGSTDSYWIRGNKNFLPDYSKKMCYYVKVIDLSSVIADVAQDTIEYINDGIAVYGTKVCSTKRGFLCQYEPYKADKCESIIDAPNNGWVHLTDGKIGTVAKYGCNVGFALGNRANAERQCLPSGLWDGTTPTCELVDCGPPPMGTGMANIFGLEDTKYGSVVEYACQSGFSLQTTDGDNTRECLANGHWSDETIWCTQVSDRTNNTATSLPVQVSDPTKNPANSLPVRSQPNVRFDGASIGIGIAVGVLAVGLVVAVVLIYRRYSSMKPTGVSRSGNPVIIDPISNPVFDNLERIEKDGEQAVSDRPTNHYATPIVNPDKKGSAA